MQLQLAIFYFVFIFTLLISATQQSAPLHCYTCSSELTAECNDPFDTARYDLLQVCMENEGCVKHTRSAQPYDRESNFVYDYYRPNVYRGCGYWDYCNYQYNPENCTICYSDECNQSNIVQISIATVVFVLIAVFVLK